MCEQLNELSGFCGIACAVYFGCKDGNGLLFEFMLGLTDLTRERADFFFTRRCTRGENH